MKYGSSTLMRAVTVVALAMMALVHVTLAQSDTETITVQVSSFECEPVGYTMGVGATVNPTKLSVPAGGTQASNPSVNFQLTVQYAGCDQWRVTAELDDFELITDPSETFQASTFELNKSTTSTTPQRWNPSPLPEWMQDLPADLDTGDPTMPTKVTFDQSGAMASGDGPLLSSSTAAYGTPGNSTARYTMNVTGIPQDQPPGTYTSTITVSLQGGDDD